MFRNVLLTAEQISELKTEVTKILQLNMESFSNKFSKLNHLTQRQDYDALYQFSKNQYNKFQNTLQNIAQFTFTIMSNFDMIWQQVHHRQSKMCELRDSLSSATNYMEELKSQIEQLRDRLNQAETYIQWIEQQKQYLDAIYYQRDRSSLLTIYSNERQMNKCVSQRNLQWNSKKQKTNIHYQKLKVYIDNLKEEKIELEKELINITKKYEIKCQECKKGNVLIEHLVERLNKRSELKEYLDTMNTEWRESQRGELSEDILKILQKAQNNSASKQNTNSLYDQENFTQNRLYFNYFDSFTQINEPTQQKDQQNNLSIIIHKQTKNACIGTDQFGRKAMACQTPSSFDQTSQSQTNQNLKIEINISGCQRSRQRNEKIVKIIQNLHIQRQIQSKLLQGQQRPKQQKREKSDVKTVDTSKIAGINTKLMSAYEYYRNRLVCSRIKKYRFDKPNKGLLKYRSPQFTN